jgi:leucyl aminopeptidase
MTLTFELSKDVPAGASAVGVAVTREEFGRGDLDWDFLRAQGFEGERDQVTVLADRHGPDTIVVGVGSSADLDLTALRRAAGNLARAGRRRETIASRLADAWPSSVDRARAARVVAEGASLALYRFDRYKTNGSSDAIERLVVVGGGGEKVRSALVTGARVGDAVALARDLVNTPGGELTPRVLAEAAKEIAESENLAITIMDEDDIASAGLGGLLGVNRGSTHPPRLIELSYEPEDARGTLALVGKGITFDSGGLSIKTADGMMTMKDDMGGAAAILGAFSAIRALSPGCRVRGYIPATDNMPGGDATRPGDVLQIRNGKTVEVLNTDAEGRLVLADALSLASEGQPDAIVDLATLTGAVEVALGSRIAAVMGNDQSLVEQVQHAADQAGEPVWQLPLPADYRKALESEVADLRNIAKHKGAGSIIAGLFLQEFVAGGIPWAHLDIAGTAWLADGAEGELTAGATGWGVRTLLELATDFRAPAKG